MLDLSVPVPTAVSVIDTDLTEQSPIERRVDTVFQIDSADGSHILAVEAQSKKDDDKRASWCYYVAYLHARYKMPVTLLVVCWEASTARWARRPIHVGLAQRPTMTTWPIALGPDNVPAITNIELAAEDVLFAVFSALTHAHSPEAPKILDVLASALNTIDLHTAGYFAEYTELGLGATLARTHWRRLMNTGTYRYQSEFAQMLRAEGEAKGRAEGQAEAEAKAILLVLKRRNICVPPEERERILACTDLETLETWLGNAATATSTSDVFSEPGEG
ncbi:hypothetical protein [Spirillospora sp. CA-294931]|uniref:hypothetical protein n=1 Tax=Spirillospora sp. CA-294931 TaxID=3240042 RepID=UPI003D8CEFEC